MRNIDFPFPRPHGFKGLFVIWLGQIISGIASSITAVALPIWIFSITDSGMAVGLLEFFFFGSYLLVVLFAGVLIDRYNRKTDDAVDTTFCRFQRLAGSAGTSKHGELCRSGICMWQPSSRGWDMPFQSPSYSAAISTMVPQKQYIRANGLMSLLNDAPEVFGPLLAGSLFMIAGLQGMLALNLIAFVISIGILLFVEIPATPQTLEGRLSQSKFRKRGSLWDQIYLSDGPACWACSLIFFTGQPFFQGLPCQLRRSIR